MYFALLISQPPHLQDARGHYPDLLARAPRTDRIRRTGYALARCLAGVAARLTSAG